jgi:hypothetical protein
MFSNSQSLITSIKNRIYRRTAVTHIATKYNPAADMARDREMDLSYVPTADMLADCFTKPLPKPTVLTRCAAMGMIGIGLGNGLGIHGNGPGIEIANGLGTGLGTLGNGDGNVHGNGVGHVIGIGNGRGIGNAVGKYIDWARLFPGDLRCLIGSLPLFVYYSLFETDMIAVLEEC